MFGGGGEGWVLAVVEPGEIQEKETSVSQSNFSHIQGLHTLST